MEFLDISDLITTCPRSTTHELISWLTECVGPVIGYQIPWPASIGSGWQLFIVSYRFKLAYPDLHVRSWGLGLEDDRDALMFRLRWL
jgi:hypothetical protein